MAITSDRGRLVALTNLVQWQEHGGYQLPADLLHSVDVLNSVQALTVPEPPPLRHFEDVAAAAVDLIARGEDVNVCEMARQAAAARDHAVQLDEARRLITLAAENAATRAVAAVGGGCNRIVTEVLQPAYETTLSETRRLARTLRGCDLNDGGWTAPAKVRQARAELTALADRHHLLRKARSSVLALAGQTAQHDTQQQFASLREPQNLVPGGYEPNRPLPRTELPQQPAAALLWLVNEGAPGTPWLPTVNEQDDAWLAVFGEVVHRRHAAHISARAYAGDRV